MQKLHRQVAFLTDRQYERLDAEVKSRGIHPAEVIRRWLDDYLDRLDAEKEEQNDEQT